MKRLAIFLVGAFLLAAAGRMAASYPIIRNFPKSLHNGGSQTWQIGCDSSGRMLFGNKCLLEFDGNSWRRSWLPNGSTVRAFLVEERPGKHRRVYLGGSEEFGYYESDPVTGQPVYRSLSQALSRRIPSFREIWDIHRLEGSDAIWFRADSHIFRYDESGITPIRSAERIFTSAASGREIYLATAKGLAELADRRILYFDNSALPAGARIVAILPYNNTVMAVTEYDGIFLLKGGALVPLATEMDPFLKSNQVFCAATRGNLFAFGTVGAGAVVKNLATGEISYANTGTGLQNNTVLSLYFDDTMNLWLGLDNGIDLALTSLPYYSLLGKAGSYGAGYRSLLRGGSLFMGTNQGLFSMPFPAKSTAAPPALTPLLRGQVWDIARIGADLFVCTDGGLYRSRDGAAFSRVPGTDGCWSVVELPNHPGYALVSAYDRLHLLSDAGGEWRDLGPVVGFDDIGGKLERDAEGYIWLPNWLKGLHRFRVDPATRRVTDHSFFNSGNGFPSDRNLRMTMFRGAPLFSTERGFYRMGADGRMAPDKRLNALIGAGHAPNAHVSPSGDLWGVDTHGISRVSISTDGKTKVDSVTLAPIAQHIIPGFDDMEFLGNDRIIVSMQDGFFDVDLSDRAGSAAAPGAPRRVYVSEIAAIGDTTRLFYPMDAPGAEIRVPHTLNSFRVRAVLPEYREGDDAVVYSFRLDDYDSDWSPYSKTPTKEYTRLREGKYKLRVRAFNSFTKERDETEVRFTVLPPWYRSVWAKCVYTLLILGALYVAFRLVERWGRRTSARVAENKERELEEIRHASARESLKKDYEISQLKSRQLEQDVKHKAEELSNVAMNVARKNEMLLDIAQRLDKLGESDDREKEISRIKTQIKKNISHDDDWRNFLHNFDIAYDDFAKRLSERFPALTQTELRVCCYLKMGLTSKDIAPIFNISYRSVEMTRYRIRRKLGMERDTNLTAFLQSL